MKSVAVVILTHNEERHVARAIESVGAFAQEVFVVDSGSTDRTREIAAGMGAVVVQHPFVNYARQFQWAIDTLPITAPWVMRLDADEHVEPPLADEIVATLPGLPDDVAGVNLRRKHIFMSRWVRHGGRYPLLLLRIWRRGRARIEDRWMDEHMVVSGGRVIALKGDFCDNNLNDLSFFTEKHNRYATREAVDVLNARWKLFAADSLIAPRSSSVQASIKRWLKERVFNHLPYPIGPLSYFVWRYVFRLGFLDGRTGLIYHLMQAFWYRALVGAKVIELEAALAGIDDKVRRLQELERLTGLRLQPNAGEPFEPHERRAPVPASAQAPAQAPVSPFVSPIGPAADA